MAILNLAELKQRASAHNNYHRANTEIWNNTTPGEFGYKWIRYHYMISAQGHLLQVQDDKYVLYANGDGTGANSFNMTAIHVMFEGNFSEQQPTDAMMRTAVELIRSIEKKYKIDPPVRGHKEVSQTGTGCPGNNLGTSKSGWLKQLITNINDKNYPPAPPSAPAPEPTPDCTEYKLQITELEKGMDTLSKENRALESKLELCAKEKVDITTKYKAEADELRSDVKRLEIENHKLDKEKLHWMGKYEELRKKCEDSQENFIEKIADWVKDILRKILNRD